MKKEVSDLRQNYLLDELLEEKVDKNPINQFDTWFQQALSSTIIEPNAMFLATISDGKPAGRVVLLKGFDAEGFVFFTNYESQKGKEIEANPNVSLTFFWDALQRQVRIEGKVEKISAENSEEYFHTRPRGSQIGAWVSDQSSSIESRQKLEDKLKAFEEKFEDLAIIPRPEHWGGYLVIPEKIEFWQGRSNRLHDRLLYSKNEKGWKLERLQP